MTGNNSIEARQNAQQLAIRSAFCGGLGTEINLEAIPEDVLPWRKRGATALMPVSWPLMLLLIGLFPIPDLAVITLANLHIRFVDDAVFKLAMSFSFATRSSPVGSRLYLAAMNAGGAGSAPHEFGYWSLGLLVFIAASAFLIAVTSKEFWSRPRIISAVIFNTLGRQWQDLLFRLTLMTTLAVGVGYAIFVSDMSGVYPDIYSGNLSLRTLAGSAFIAAVHGGAIFLLFFITLAWFATSVISLEGFARCYRWARNERRSRKRSGE